MEKTVTLRSPGGWVATIYHYGAHVTSYKSPNGTEHLFLSDTAIFAPPTAIRGGIPICFPQFADMGPLQQQHGFARNSMFTLVASTPTTATLQLTDSEDTRRLGYPYNFTLLCHVDVSKDGILEQSLVVRNTSNDSFSFTCALHTYFRIQDISTTYIRGLHNTRYLDSLQERKEIVPDSLQGPQALVTFGVGEVDRIYCGIADDQTISVLTSTNKNSTVTTTTGALEEDVVVSIQKKGFVDAVVWNPYIEKSKKMKDMEPEGYKRMLCVEMAVAGSGNIQLKPGDEWSGTQTLVFSSSSL